MRKSDKWNWRGRDTTKIAIGTRHADSDSCPSLCLFSLYFLAITSSKRAYAHSTQHRPVFIHTTLGNYSGDALQYRAGPFPYKPLMQTILGRHYNKLLSRCFVITYYSVIIQDVEGIPMKGGNAPRRPAAHELSLYVITMALSVL